MSRVASFAKDLGLAVRIVMAIAVANALKVNGSFSAEELLCV